MGQKTGSSSQDADACISIAEVDGLRMKVPPTEGSKF